MIERSKDWAPLIGRLLVGGMFLAAGVQKVMNFGGTVAFVGTAFPFPEIVAPAAVLIEIGAGLALILGWQTRFAAALLGVFTVAATGAYHLNLADQLQMTLFLKNAAILGGLLAYFSFGPGKYAVGREA